MAGEKMSSVTKKKTGTWTKLSLRHAINKFKEKKDFHGLIQFLEIRIADEAPCCVSMRARFWNELGLAKIEQQDLDQAKICFENALLIEPDYTAARYNLATFAMQQGDLPAALDQYDAVLKDNPEHFDALFNAGLCHSHSDEKEAALSLLLRAARLRPEHGRVQFLTGETLLQVGRASEALPFFRSAHKENHGHYESAMGFAISLLENKNYNDAITICEQALMTFGSATLPMQLKGDALLALNRIEEAVQCHIDLCHIDLDIRDFVVTRLQKLAQEDPAAFTTYATAVRDHYPDFESIIGADLEKGHQPLDRP
jgi:tetratricopeptide (TPR) repeat protein